MKTVHPSAFSRRRRTAGTRQTNLCSGCNRAEIAPFYQLQSGKFRRTAIIDAQNPSVAFARILVVEDFKPFRTTISSLLVEKSDFRVICEVADGLEAVEKAQELKPDLILLDIGLPSLNGIEAARRIRKLLPELKLVFLTQESSADVVREALSLGACGYVLKSLAGSDLLAALTAVLHGKQFVSSGLHGHGAVDGDDSGAAH